MDILITGGGGFLGQALARRLLATPDFCADLSLTLADLAAPPGWSAEPRVRAVACDITDTAALSALVTPATRIVYHLAAIVSGQAEREFDLGMRVNLDATRTLLEVARRLPQPPIFVFASSLAVYGGELPAVVGDRTALSPQSSYGTQKSVGELLVQEYSRRGWVDGRALRLPTISVRPGKPNQAASSFASGIIREPLHGQPAICPVGRGVRMWLSSPQAAIANLVHAARVPAAQLGLSRSLNAPGLSVTVEEMVRALEKVAGPAAVARIRFEPQEAVERIVSTWPGEIDIRRAVALGFERDRDFESVIRAYVAEQGLGTA